jgi:hypothetical protein
MAHKGCRSNGLMTSSKMRAREGQAKARAEREAAALRLREGLAARYRAVRGLADDGVIPFEDELLLQAACSAALEVSVTTARFIVGRARPQSLERASNARSELRRILLVLRMVANDSEVSAPPSGITIDDLKREYADRAAQ